MEKLINNKENPLVIPFGKAVRVGNFKLWRSNFALVSGREKSIIECVDVSTIDGSWYVRIPSTSAMYGTICNGYATTDESIRENFLGMIFTNMYNVSIIPSEALHDAFSFLVEMMSFPYLILSEEEMGRRMAEGLRADGMDDEKANEHITKMLDYRRKLWELIEKKKDAFIADYELQQAERRNNAAESQKEMEQEELAEEALKNLN